MSFDPINVRPPTGLNAQATRPVNPVKLGTVILAGMNTAFVKDIGHTIYNPDTGQWHSVLCAGNPPVAKAGPGIDLTGE